MFILLKKLVSKVTNNVTEYDLFVCFFDASLNFGKSANFYKKTANQDYRFACLYLLFYSFKNFLLNIFLLLISIRITYAPAINPEVEIGFFHSSCGTVAIRSPFIP